MSCPKEFIVQVKMDDYYCITCGCDLPGCNAILEHLGDPRHQVAVEMYSKDISLIGNNHQYYCNMCDRLISGYFNVYEHLNGRKHNNSRSAVGCMGEEEEEEKEYEEEDDFMMYEDDDGTMYNGDFEYNEGEAAIVYEEEEAEYLKM